jgi:hypothetical protein
MMLDHGFKPLTAGIAANFNYLLLVGLSMDLHPAKAQVVAAVAALDRQRGA